MLSGGQKQRVALARALVSHPRVLAFDEPLGALDALTRISMQRLLERVWLDQGFTAILVTHDVAEAVALADRVLVIEDGRIAHDIKVDIARPRQRGSADLAAWKVRSCASFCGGRRRIRESEDHAMNPSSASSRSRCPTMCRRASAISAAPCATSSAASA